MTNFDLGAVASGVTLDAEGLWHATNSEAISYPADGNAACLAVEDSSLWFRHRNRCIEAAVSAALPSKQGFFLDVGAGNGYVARGLMQAGHEVVAVEPGLAGARSAKARGVSHVICATTQACRFAPHSVPAAGAFDVVEHIADDVGFLSHLRGLLRADGALVLTVPAYPALWSQDDADAGHQRRYTAASLRSALESAGWRVDFETYFFRWLPVPIALVRALPYRLGMRRSSSISGQAARDHAATRPWTARAIERALASEVRNIRQRRRMAFGGSLLVIARPAGAKAE